VLLPKKTIYHDIHDVSETDSFIYTAIMLFRYYANKNGETQDILTNTYTTTST